MSKRAVTLATLKSFSKGTNFPFEIEIHIAIPRAIQDGEEEDDGADGQS